MFAPFTSSTCVCLFTLILRFYFLLYLPPLFLFLTYMKSMVNLHNSCNEVVDVNDDLLLSTGYEPKAHDFYETTVEPYVQLLNSPALLSDKTSRTPTTMTLHSKTCSTEHIEFKPITQYEKTCFSVCRRRQCPIEQGNLLEIDRGNPGEHRSSEAQIRTLLDHQKKQILAECRARISQHEFQAARGSELYIGTFWPNTGIAK